MFEVYYPYENKEYTAWLQARPWLVAKASILNLKQELAMAATGQSVILQAGDCAEKFFVNDIVDQHNHLVIMAQVLEQKFASKVTLIGRLAGQYAKPRSVNSLIDGNLPYYGDLVNGVGVKHRRPNPKRMLVAYQHVKRAHATLSKLTPKLYTSHECLVLEYERGLTRVIESGDIYNMGADLLWLGARSVKQDVLIDYLAGLVNPVAVKLAPSLSAVDLVKLLQRLNPNNETGKLLLIPRLGVDKVAKVLPGWIAAVQNLPFGVSWAADPMHGNTKIDNFGVKYRLLTDVIAEYIGVNKIFKACYGYNIGLHLEATYQANILECVVELADLQAKRYYLSPVDPRLNKSQSLQFINAIS